MTNPVLTKIEEIYEIGLNPTQPYLLQLEPLGASGELANRNKTNELLFALSEIVDRQQKEIKALQEDRLEIAKQMATLMDKPQPAINPTVPLDEKTTNRTEPETNNSL